MTVINLDGIVGWDIDPRQFSNQIDEIEGDITLEMNSPGGYITDGLSIMNKIKSYDKGNITANITYAASMMTQIAMACDEINCYDNSVFMIHNAQGVAIGDARAMNKQSKILSSFNNMLAKNYINKTGKDAQEIEQMMNDETFLFGEEIKSNNFADNIIKTDNDIDESTALAMIESAKENFSNCLSKMKDKIEDPEKIAAVLPNFNVNNDNKKDNKNQHKDKNNIMIKNKFKGEGMAEGSQEINVDEVVNTALTEERTRVSTIMSIDCKEELKIEAIKDGKSPGQLALEVNALQKAEKGLNKKAFEEASKTANVNTPEVDPEVSNEEKSLSEAEAALDKL